MMGADKRTSAVRAPAWLGYVLVLIVVLAAVTLFLLATAAANTARFAEHYPLLLALNVAVAVALMLLVCYQLFGLRRKLRLHVFGAKLRLRLVLLFAMIGVVPGALIYGVSVQFLGKSIESWFEASIDKALDAGLNLARNTLDNALKDLTAKADAIATALSTRPPDEHLSALNALREQAGVREASLYTQRGKLIAYSGSERSAMTPEAPTPEALRELRLRQRYAAIEAIPERGLYLRAIVQVNVVSLSEEARAVQLMQPVPEAIGRDAETVQTGYREYQELLLSRRGLKRLYATTLTLALLLALLSALAASFLLSERLAAPLNVLVEGTRAVAQGDFSQRAADTSPDELGMLTRSFNSMTVQLADARAQAEHKEAQLAHAKAQLESILNNLSAGVLAFDENLKLTSANRSADEVLRVECAPFIERELGAWDTLDPSLAPRVAGDSRRVRHAAPRRVGAAGRAPREGRHTGPAPARLAPSAGRRYRVCRGLRRRDASSAGATRRGLERGRAAARARNQEPAHADSAFRRARGGQARAEAAQGRRRDAHACDAHDRQSGRGAEAHGRCLQPVCAIARGGRCASSI